ncbi:MAG: phenylacetate--CoA ligase family protein, partial [Deltaproteobacteria bacterium]|nr:phenylacetate--CoA ligase family protein [Deltaproteobacteria bacterium]
MSFIDSTLTPERLAQIQLDGLRWTVGHALANSPFYRERLAAAGVEDAREIRSLQDLAHLPFVDN